MSFTRVNVATAVCARRVFSRKEIAEKDTPQLLLPFVTEQPFERPWKSWYVLSRSNTVPLKPFGMLYKIARDAVLVGVKEQLVQLYG